MTLTHMLWNQFPINRRAVLRDQGRTVKYTRKLRMLSPKDMAITSQQMIMACIIEPYVRRGFETLGPAAGEFISGDKPEDLLPLEKPLTVQESFILLSVAGGGEL